ncbi:uncharacterized protein K02A2.6-like [Cimex lectularius]|uniref:RNA-directed DNA polymerase n=1 Tax=Cimex lectularius TaxID=79782 RepID=A0A8I6SEX5_CIMLE|nr:uncharacterized protein K02A2.6-like [Cimex lectularius]
MVTFYIKFIPKAAEILHPLYSLLKQNNRWIWSEKCEQAFKKIKQVLTSRPVLTHFDQKLPLRLTVDASAKAVGAVLSHVLPEGERPIAYASQVLNSAQQKYPSIEREAYAIIFGCTKFKDYLFCKEFELVTDYRPLMYIFGARKKLPVYAANRLQRWAYLISNYNYSIKCVKSKDNCAYYLSRIDWGKQPAIDPLDEVNYFHFVAETVPFRLDWKKIKQGTRNDPELSRVVDSVVQGYRLPREIKYEPFIRRDKELTVEKGCLMWGYRVIIPQKFRETVLRELHANHFGSTKMKSLARSYFWWPSLDSDIENISKDCEVCCRFRENPPKSILQPWSWPSTTWTRLHVDFLGPINRNHCCLVVMDATSKWIENFFVVSMTAAVVIEKLQELFARFGLPRAITIDGAKCFTGKEFTSFLDSLGIVHLCGAPFHPQTNGAAESAVNTMKRCIQKTLASKENISLKTAVDLYLFQYRNMEHYATGETPASMLLKKQPRTIFTQMLPSSEGTFKYEAKMIKNSGRRNLILNKEDQIWAKDFREQKPKWTKGVVVKRLGNQTFLVKTEEGKIWKRHTNQLWPGSSRNYEKEQQDVQKERVDEERWPSGAEEDVTNNPEENSTKQETEEAEDKETSSERLPELMMKTPRLLRPREKLKPAVRYSPSSE